MEAIVLKLLDSTNTVLLVVLVLIVLDMRLKFEEIGKRIKDIEDDVKKHHENFVVHCSPEKARLH